MYGPDRVFKMTPIKTLIDAGITVVGSGTARAVPDVAEWSFGVQTAGESEGSVETAIVNAADGAT